MKPFRPRALGKTSRGSFGAFGSLGQFSDSNSPALLRAITIVANSHLSPS